MKLAKSAGRIFGFAALLILFYGSSAFGQIDIQNNSRNALIDLGRGLKWGSGGRGNIHNAYVFTPTSPSESFCLMVANNNPTNAHTFNLVVASTSDQQVTSYLTAPGSTRWVTATAVSGASAPAAGSYYNFFRINGASRVAVSITGSTTQAGSPDTADFTIGQSTVLDVGGTSCGPNNNPMQTSAALFNGATYDAPYYCPNSNKITIAAGTDFLLVTGVAATTTKICHLSFSSDVAADFNLQYGTGATCGTGTVTITGVYKNVQTFVEDWPQKGPSTLAAGTNLCIHFSGAVTTGGLVTYVVF